MPSPFEGLRDVPQGPGFMTENQAQRADFLSKLAVENPQKFSELIARLNTVQGGIGVVPNQERGALTDGDQLRASMGAVEPNQEMEKARAKRALEKEIEKGKEAQKVKAAVKSLDDLRELQRSKALDQQQL